MNRGPRPRKGREEEARGLGRDGELRVKSLRTLPPFRDGRCQQALCGVRPGVPTSRGGRGATCGSRQRLPPPPVPVTFCRHGVPSRPFQQSLLRCGARSGDPGDRAPRSRGTATEPSCPGGRSFLVLVGSHSPGRIRVVSVLDYNLCTVSGKTSWVNNEL